MRYEKRDAEIVRMRCEDKWTLQEIGDRFSLTRERVRQILERHGITCTAFKTLDKRVKQVTVPCLMCGVGIPTMPSRVKGWKRPFCSDDCKRDYFFPLVECAQCGRAFRRRRHIVRQNKRDKRYSGIYFCTTACFRAYQKKDKKSSSGLARFHLREYLRHAGIPQQETVSVHV